MKKKPSQRFWKDKYGGIHWEDITESVDKVETTPTFEPKEELQALIDLKDMEEELATALLDKYGTIENLKEATEEELTEISGIGKKRAKSIWQQLKEL